MQSVGGRPSRHHPCWRGSAVSRRADGLAHKRHTPHPRRVERGETRGHRPQPVERGVVLMGEREDGILAEKTAQARRAAQRQRADEKRERRPSHRRPQSPQLPDVLPVGAVDDAAGAEEQQRLEKRVRGEVIHARARPAQPHRHHHVAKLAQRRVREDALQVRFHDGQARREKRRRATDPRDHGQDGAQLLEQPEGPAEHVDPGRHHRGRMDERGDRRGSFHRIRQPHVQRKLRRLAQHPAEQQQPDPRQRRRGQPPQLHQVRKPLVQRLELHAALSGDRA